MQKNRLHSKSDLFLRTSVKHSKLGRQTKSKIFLNCNNSKRNNEENIKREIQKKRMTKTLLKLWINDCTVIANEDYSSRVICTKGKFKAHTSLFGEKSRISCKELCRCSYGIFYGIG